jgi:PKD repeat protein
MRAFLFSLALLAQMSVAGQSLLLPNSPQCNGPVNTIAQRGDTVLLGGSFTRVYTIENSGSYGVVANKTTGDVAGYWPKPNGAVTKAISDGSGGWYIGGWFTKIGDSTRNRIAHVDSMGRVTSRFSGKGFNNLVNALALHQGNLYVGGTFSSYGAMKSFGVAVNMNNGKADSNGVIPDGWLNTVISDGRGGWFIGGGFTRVGGVIRKGIAHIDSTGSLTDWSPHVNGVVYSLALTGRTLYVGGYFTSAGNFYRNNVAAIDIYTGDVLPWNPNVNATVYCLAVDKNRVYVGGGFTLAGGQSRNYLAAIDTASGAPISWNPGTNGRVSSLAVGNGVVYVGGFFTSAGGATRSNFATIDSATGNANAFSPNPNNEVKSLLVNDSLLYIGGRFTNIGGNGRNHLAAIHIGSSTITSWNPNPNYDVYSISHSDSMLFLGGDFTSVGGQPRNYVAAVSKKTGSLLGWNPDPNARVYSLAASNNKVYLGGDFQGVGDLFCSYLVSLDTTTFDQVWMPQPDNQVTELAIYSGKIYVAGNFASIAGQTRNRIASFTLSNKALTTWAPSVNSQIEEMTLHGGRLYIGGVFTSIDGNSRGRVASFDLATGNLTSWNPGSNGVIYGLAGWKNVMYASGQFSTIGGQSRNNLAAIDTSSATATAWNINVNNYVLDLAVVNDTLFIGGGFTTVSSLGRPYTASFNLNTGALTTWATNPNGAVNTIAFDGSKLYLGGSFGAIGGRGNPFFAAISKKSGTLFPWTFSPNALINTIAVDKNVIYIGGGFTTINGQSRSRAAAFDAITGGLKTWNPNADLQVNRIFPNDSTVFMAGFFQNIGGQPRARLACVDTSSGSALSWNPGVSSDVYSIVIQDTTMYIAGRFGTIGGQSRSSLATLNTKTGAVHPLNFGTINSGIYSILFKDSTLFLGGAFNQINGQVRNLMASVNTSTGLLTPWSTNNPVVNSEVYVISRIGDLIYVGGALIDSFGMRRNHIKAVNSETGLAYEWAPDPDNWVTGMVTDDDGVYAIGLFTKMNDMSANRVAFLRPYNKINVGKVLIDSICAGEQLSIVFSSKGLSVKDSFYLELTKISPGIQHKTMLGPVYRLPKGQDTVVFTTNVNMPHGNYTARLIAGKNKISNAFSVFVYEAPHSRVVVNTEEKCQSQGAFLFTDSSLINSGFVANRFWLFSDNDTSTLLNPVKQFSNYGTYSARLIVTSNQGCRDTALKSIRVHPKTNISYSTNDSMQCLSGNIFVFTNSSSIDSGSYTFLWQLGAMDTSIQNTVSKSYTTHGTYQIQLTTYTNQGCKDSLVKTVVVHPQTNIGFTINDSDQCLINNMFNYTNMSSLSTGIFSSLWHFGNGDTSTQSSPSKSFLSAGSYIVKLVTTTNYGCKDSLIKGVVVYPNPIASFTTDSTQCLTGNQFVMNNGSSGSPTSYHWNFGNSTTSVNTNPSVSYASAGNYSIRLVAQNSFGCNDTVVKNVRVKQNPATPVFTYSPDTVVCDNINIVLKTGDTNTRSWMKNGAHLGITTDSLVVTNSAGSYSLKVTNTENCDATSTTSNLFFKPTPVKPIVTVSGNVLTSSSTTGNQWYNSTGIISGETGQTYSASSVGQYYTIVTFNGCPSASSDVVNFPATGMASISKNNSVSVYPNPNNGSFTIVPDQRIDGEVLVKLFDLTGRIVFEEVRSDNNLSIQTTGLANGTYMLVIQTNDGLSKVKIAIFR